MFVRVRVRIEISIAQLAKLPLAKLPVGKTSSFNTFVFKLLKTFEQHSQT